MMEKGKYYLNNYRPISLLPIFGKIFENVIYNNLFKYFHKNKFLSVNQSGFCSCSQLFAITHEIYKAFDCNPSLETRGVYLDISKSFDKIKHEGLSFKLKCYCLEDISTKLENIIYKIKQYLILLIRLA